MSRLGSRRLSISPKRYHRRRDSRSPGRRDRYRSPDRGRGSPDYGRYSQQNGRKRKPSWMDEDISEDELREQAGGDPAEFRRLKRLKLNERGARGFWRNTPTPSPSPERTNRQSDKVSHQQMENGHAQPANDLPAGDAIKDAAEQADASTAASDGAVSSLQDEILAMGPEAAELHQKLAALFNSWLADEKKAAAELERRRKQYEADNIMVGPVLEAAEKAEVDYGTHMRPGEGTAMAAYVQSGKRIPRRGEVGMSADQISTYEDLGYVMSGSRHNRMNAIRMRKENQVYTAEEKAALAMFNMEENKRKEQKILGDMQRLVQRTIGDVEEEAQEDEDEEAEVQEQEAS